MKISCSQEQFFRISVANKMKNKEGIQVELYCTSRSCDFIAGNYGHSNRIRRSLIQHPEANGNETANIF